MPNIKCTVTECKYNTEVVCRAPMIEVTRNKIGHASKSDETKCETFKKK